MIPTQNKYGLKWTGTQKTKINNINEIAEAVKNIKEPLFILSENGNLFYSTENEITSDKSKGLDIIAFSMPIEMEDLGDRSFCESYGIKYPYIGGSMAKGISSPKIVEELYKIGCLGFIGTGGYSLKQLDIDTDDLLQRNIRFGCNIINTPSNYSAEKNTVELMLKKGINIAEASAYIELTPALIKYAVKGLKRNDSGEIVRKNKIVAKASRIEVAKKFFSPAPEKILKELLNAREITEEEYKLALEIPVAEDITAEADSGGHTDSRPAPSLLGSFIELRDEMQKKYTQKFRIGFGGGIGSPASASMAFASGASYIVTGTINQACQESGTSDTVRQMLSQASQADTAIAPSADMFEIGAKVQVLKKGTLFPMRAQKLYNIYCAYQNIDEILEKERKSLETTIFRDSLENIWLSTKKFFETTDPEMIKKAESSPKFKMALIFRSYLGQSAKWPIIDQEDRKIDFQIWCGPAIGTFNQWCKGSFMEDYKNRKVADVALNILYGVAVYQRLLDLRRQGIELFSAIDLKPRQDIII